MDPSPDQSQHVVAPDVEYCYLHPKTPTRLHCTRCDRPICGRCAIPASVGQHCPECVAEARRSAPKVRSALQATAPAVMVLLVINIGMFILQFATGGLGGGITGALVMDPFAIANGEWYRLFSAMFLHASILHIALNSYVLYALGPNVEQAFGTFRFVLMYVVSGFTASALSFAVPPSTASLGASGAVFGIAGVLLVFLFNRRSSQFVGQYLRNIVGFIVLNLIFGFVFPGIDNMAHVGGLVGGIVLGFAFDRRGAAAVPVQVLTTLGVVAVAIALVVIG